MKVVIELIKDGRVILRFFETGKTLDKKLKEIKERFHYDSYNIKFVR